MKFLLPSRLPSNSHRDCDMNNRRIQVIDTAVEMRGWVTNAIGRVGLVPTMGALHEGHLSLAQESVAACENTVATIFVNPTQFAPDEDLDQYPRTLDADLNQLDAIGVDVAFVPSVDTMYPNGEEVTIQPPPVARRWEGANRPNHFSGVCTIVEKLFRIIPADIAFFGQKDFQQTRVIMAMVRQLGMDIDLRVCPIVREPSGLAMSSRNQYLTDPDRELATSIHRVLREAQAAAQVRSSSPQAIAREAETKLKDAGISKIDYVAVVDPDSLEPLDTWHPQSVMVVAAYVGSTRLIDNMFLTS